MNDDPVVVQLRPDAPIRNQPNDPAVANGGGGPHDPTMEQRVTRLEVQMEGVRDDLKEIKGDLKTVVARLTELPTKRDLMNYSIGGIAVGIGIIAVVVGGIIGGLAWIQPTSSPNAAQPPIIINNIPSSTAPAAPPSTPAK